MKTGIRLAVAVVALLCAAAVPARADVASAIQDAWSLNLQNYNRHDVDGTMRTIDSRSPDYASTKQALEEQFKDLDVKAELVKFDYIGHDDEFVVARIKTKTTGKPGSGFVDNIVDAVVVFHQENGTWKVWNEDILGVQFLQ
jgi:hypothetical protein